MTLQNTNSFCIKVQKKKRRKLNFHFFLITCIRNVVILGNCCSFQYVNVFNYQCFCCCNVIIMYLLNDLIIATNDTTFFYLKQLIANAQ
jgi:hypothetical protein